MKKLFATSFIGKPIVYIRKLSDQVGPGGLFYENMLIYLFIQNVVHLLVESKIKQLMFLKKVIFSDEADFELDVYIWNKICMMNTPIYLIFFW